MRPLLSLLTLALVLVGCENVQDPGELTLQTRDALDVLPAGVQTAGMVNLDHARASDAFAILSGGGFSAMNAGGEHAARFDDFIAATGFDPDEDLHRVYFGFTEGDADPTPYFVVYADYDRARLDAYVSDQADLQFERSDYADAPVYVTRDDGDEMAFALVNDDMIVASTRAGVYAMLDRIEAGGQGLGGDAEMVALIGRAGYPDDAWVAVRDLPEHATPVSSDSADQGFGQVGRMMDDVVLSIGFEDDGLNVKAVGVTRPGADAGDVADLVRGTVSAMKLSVESEQAVFDVLDGVRVEEARDGVEVEAFLTEAALRTMHAQGDA